MFWLNHCVFAASKFSVSQDCLYSFYSPCIDSFFHMGACLGRKVALTPTFVLQLPYWQGVDILIPRLPYSAWRLLMDYLQTDATFCHCAIPYFHSSGVITVFLNREQPTYDDSFQQSLKTQSLKWRIHLFWDDRSNRNESISNTCGVFHQNLTEAFRAWISWQTLIAQTASTVGEPLLDFSSWLTSPLTQSHWVTSYFQWILVSKLLTWTFHKVCFTNVWSHFRAWLMYFWAYTLLHFEYGLYFFLFFCFRAWLM